jgi:YbbR domain-containing protein
MMGWLRRLPRALAFFARGAVTSVVGNISLALLALLLALSLWLYVTDRENPKEVQTFNRGIVVKFVNVPNDLAVAGVSETSVRIRIEAPRNELDRLDTEDFEATVDLGGAEHGRSTLAVDVSPPNSRINVVEVTPPRIDVTIEPLQVKEVPVDVALVGSPQQGFAALNQGAEPGTAMVSGPESLVALVESVVASVNLAGVRTDIADERVELVPRDARGGEISRVQVDPTTAAVSVGIEQQQFSQQFVVTPAITGQPPAGYNVAGITVAPPIVTLTGSLEALRSIDAVSGVATEEISIADNRADVVRQVALRLPADVSAGGANAVTVTVAIAPAQGEAVFRLSPRVVNAAGGLTATVSDTVLVMLAGEVPVLQGIGPEQIAVTVNADGLGAGLHVLSVEVAAPPLTRVARVEPGSVGVALAPRP